MPTVSIIIPTYNRTEYLRAAVASVIAQTFSDWECIVVDDGSTDSPVWAGSLDPRVRVIREENGGLSVARNNGILNSSGEFIALLDDDDLWEPGKLAQQVAAMQADPTCGLCFTNFQTVDEFGKKPEKSGPPTPAATGYLQMLAKMTVIVPSSVIVRRSLLPRASLFDPMMAPGSEDRDFFLRMARCSKVVHIPLPLTLYRVHGNNVSRNYFRPYLWGLYLIKKHALHAHFTGDGELQAAARRANTACREFFSHQAYGAARQAFREGNRKAMAAHLARAAAASPLRAISSLAKFPLQRAVAARQRANPESIP